MHSNEASVATARTGCPDCHILLDINALAIVTGLVPLFKQFRRSCSLVPMSCMSLPDRLSSGKESPEVYQFGRYQLSTKSKNSHRRV